MTRDILIYTLACGCTDWCTCEQCAQGIPHEVGTPFGCTHHDVTTITAHVPQPDLDAPVQDGEVAIIGSHDLFTLAADHPMRAGHCVICHQPIGDQPLTVICVAGLGGPSCTCGMVPGAAYLIHGSHLNDDPTTLLPHLETAMDCQHTHPWTD